VLGTEPWMRLHYGIVSLRGRPWTQAAEAMRELVLEAETDSTHLGQRLLERHASRPQRARPAQKKKPKSHTR
jgi:hypothetical protein